MSRVLPTLSVLTQEVFRMIQKIRELREKVLAKDDEINRWWTRAQSSERRIVALTEEMAEKYIKIGEKEDEIAALNAELAAVRIANKLWTGSSTGNPWWREKTS
ncbi:hypothetical protein EAE96_007677 [Botrytis aclada]|nr:hypothetical protein EAE96_007677 [Botrytis aclada]